MAMLCDDCSFGNKKEHCTKCDKWMGVNQTPAVVCSDCSFGTKKDYCAKCQKWMGNNSTPAYLCSDCSFGSKRDDCVICDRSAGWFIYLPIFINKFINNFSNIN